MQGLEVAGPGFPVVAYVEPKRTETWKYPHMRRALAPLNGDPQAAPRAIEHAKGAARVQPCEVRTTTVARGRHNSTSIDATKKSVCQDGGSGNAKTSSAAAPQRCVKQTEAGRGLPVPTAPVTYAGLHAKRLALRRR